MLPHEKKQEILDQITQFKALSYPDRDLTRQLMKNLRIYDIVDLEFALNKVIPKERLAALKMVERYLTALLSEKEAEWAEAKDTLKQIYYQVREMDEEGFL